MMDYGTITLLLLLMKHKERVRTVSYQYRTGSVHRQRTPSALIQSVHILYERTRGKERTERIVACDVLTDAS
jgi:hypothetical protein